MTQPPLTGNTFAPLPNVASFVEMFIELRDRPRGLPGLGVAFGPAGWGKSSAAIYAVNRFDAHFVAMRSVWTKKKLCTAILEDMGMEPARTIADMVDQIGENLAVSGRSLIIDEADYLEQKNMIEIVRDIYESSFAPIILIGEEEMPVKLRRHERFHGRIYKWVQFQPATREDVDALALAYCPGIMILDDLKDALFLRLHQSVRRISNELWRANVKAKTAGVTEFGLADWGDDPFFDGEPPRPRRATT